MTRTLKTQADVCKTRYVLRDSPEAGYLQGVRVQHNMRVRPSQLPAVGLTRYKRLKRFNTNKISCST
jgi:hypothetical protein